MLRPLNVSTLASVIINRLLQLFIFNSCVYICSHFIFCNGRWYALQVLSFHSKSLNSTVGTVLICFVALYIAVQTTQTSCVIFACWGLICKNIFWASPKVGLNGCCSPRPFGSIKVFSQGQSLIAWPDCFSGEKTNDKTLMPKTQKQKMLSRPKNPNH